MTADATYVYFYEGPSDLRFLEAVFEPRLQPKWRIQKWKLNTMTQEEKKAIVRLAVTRKRPIVLIYDIDDFVCYSVRVRQVLKSLQVKTVRCVTIVILEIEGWYLAGMSNNLIAELSFPFPKDVESVRKEDFDSMARKIGYSSVQLTLKILESYDIKLARARSDSFDHFWRHWVEPYA